MRTPAGRTARPNGGCGSPRIIPGPTAGNARRFAGRVTDRDDAEVVQEERRHAGLGAERRARGEREP